MPQSYPQDLAHLRRRLRKGDKGEVRGQILPFKRGAGGELSFAMPEAMREAGVGLIDMMAGTRTGDLTPEATAGLLDFMGGGAATAPMRATGSAGIFGGLLAHTADLDAFEHAKKLQKKGIKSNQPEGDMRRQIWDETGWFQGPDNLWRFEIDDSESVVDSAGAIKRLEDDHWKQIGVTEDASIIAHRARNKGISLEEAAEELRAQRRVGHHLGTTPLFGPTERPLVDPRSIEMARTTDPAALKAQTEALYAQKPGTGPMEVQNAVKHQRLFDAYPNLAIRPFHRAGIELGLGTYGGYNPAKDEISVSKFYATGPQERTTTLHELQHAVQRREGFQMGGSPSTVMQLPGADVIGKQIIKDVKVNAQATIDNVRKDAETFIEGYNKSANSPVSKIDDAIQIYLIHYPDVADQYKKAVKAMEVADSPDALQRMAPFIYQRLAGEVEARNVQARRNMTPLDRRVQPPWMTQDTPDHRQLIFTGNTLMQALGHQ